MNKQIIQEITTTTRPQSILITGKRTAYPSSASSSSLRFADDIGHASPPPARAPAPPRSQLSYVIFAACRNIQAYIAAQVFFATGRTGHKVSMLIFIVGMASLVHCGVLMVCMVLVDSCCHRTENRMNANVFNGESASLEEGRIPRMVYDRSLSCVSYCC